ncbi:MAG TPA: Hsp20/alpha crystallin family protein [Verrucomicrobiales bacterium]|nr:Hsp20/alpha crystallin family protein [Verrucomicrobiales bacterium]
MKLIRYDYPELPLGTSEFARWIRDAIGDSGDLRDPFSSWTGGGAGRNALAVDLYENEEAFHAVADLPGFSKSQVQVELENSVLQISCSKGENQGEVTERFSRSFSVPDGIDTAKVAARLEDGILSVTLPKSENRRPRVVTID